MTAMPVQTTLDLTDVLSKFFVPLLVAALAAYFSTNDLPPRLDTTLS